MRKILNVALSLVLVISMLTTSSIQDQIKAEENSTYVNEEQGAITIGNDYISRTLSQKENHILTSSILNKRTNMKTIPQEGSEDFAIHLLNKQESIVQEPTQDIDRSDWKATLTNKDNVAFSADALPKLFDGDLSTYIDDYKKAGQPFTLDIDLGTEQQVRSFSVDKRPGYSDPAYGTNGTMGKFELYVSDDGQSWNTAGKGEFTKDAYGLHQEGQLHNVGNRVFANFDQTYTTRYVRIVQVSTAIGSAAEFTSSELHLYKDAYSKADETDDKQDMILSSELVYDTHKVENLDQGKKLTIHYTPVSKNAVEYTINQVFVIEGSDHYMRSFIEIEASDDEKAQIDYIDTDRFVLPEDAQGVWTHPEDSDVSSMWIGKHELMLGQPIYVNGLFMGSEFPAADTIVNEQTTQIRYYSGKTFKRLKADNQLTKDGKFVSWQNVVGAAEGIDTAVVQTSFFEYIEKIATPTEFRKQYNSWYDNMMNITDESIATSFLGAEAGLNKEGIEPMDSYVVDDGWNNYYDGKYTANPGSSQGTTPNQTGFWEFNAKFPNELYTSSALSNKLQSSFGLWLGPQGGYNYFGTFGQFIEASGTGYAQNDFWQNVCVGSDKYVKNLQTLFIDYQQRFDIDYWKWDGFAVRPCTNAKHDHMTGGPSDMYYTTDLWEKWTDLFENAREARAKEGKGLWINATCYVNLSPWLLQWVNTVWVQDSGDTGQAGTGARHEQKIYYRDKVYHNLYKKNQVQFPLKHIYNHDPIYGVSDGSSATADEFRQYMFANAVRGTAFWELYFSPSIFDEAKWKITADALSFAETNFEVLKNAKMFGNVPTDGVYGYSSWNDDEGIISFTNPLDSEQTYSLTMNDIVGVPKTLKDAKGIQVLPYEVGTLDQSLSYGNELNITLAPHETKILHYNHKDITSPSVVSIANQDDTHIRIKFSERVNVDGEYKVNGLVVSSKLLDDYRTIELTTEAPLASGTVNVQFKNVQDTYGNSVKDKAVMFQAYHGGIIADLSNLDDTAIDTTTGNTYAKLDGTSSELTDKGMQGDGSFAVSFTLKSASNNAVILKQGKDITLEIDHDGFLKANIKGQELTTKETVTTVTEKAHGLFNTDAYVPTKHEQSITGKINDGKNHSITVSKEVNGMIKLYVDGKLASSAYDISKNGSISMDSVMLGSTSLKGAISNFVMVNHAIDYEEAKAISDKSLGVDSMKEIDRSAWTAEACSEMPEAIGDSNAMAAIDGNLSTWWHTNYAGDDQHEGNHSIDIDFHQSTTLDEIHYTGRGGANGDVAKYNLFAKQNGEWIPVVSEGTFESNKAVNIIKLDSSLTADGLRFELLDTVGGFGAAKEIQVFTYDQDITSKEVKSVYTSLKQIFDKTDAKLFTTDSYKVYKNAFNQFDTYYKAVNDGGKTTKFVLAKMEEQVTIAYEQLVEKGTNVEKEELQKRYDEYLNVKNIGYSDSSWNGFMDAMKHAKAVLVDANATQEDVDEAITTLSAAYENLAEDTNLTKSILKSAIDKAKAVDKTHVVPAVVKLLEKAIAKAELVYEDFDASNAECLNAWMELANAMHYLEFKADKQALEILVKECKAIKLDDYKDGVVEFEAALQAAQTALAKENILQATLDKVYSDLEFAKNALVAKDNVDKALLEEMLNLIKTEVGDGALYKKDMYWTAFEQALQEAQRVIEDSLATQLDVHNAINTLASTYENLRLIPSEDQLKTLNDFVQKANGIHRNLYTTAQLETIDAVMAESQAMLQDFDSKKYTILEKKMANTTTMIDRIEHQTEGKPNSPDTSDSSNIASSMVMLAVSGVFIYFFKKKKEEA